MSVYTIRLENRCRNCDHQEERERAERAEDQLDQLTRSLAQEKSTSSALQAERAALERLQVLSSLSGPMPCLFMATAASRASPKVLRCMCMLPRSRPELNSIAWCAMCTGRAGRALQPARAEGPHA